MPNQAGGFITKRYVGHSNNVACTVSLVNNTCPITFYCANNTMRFLLAFSSQLPKLGYSIELKP